MENNMKDLITAIGTSLTYSDILASEVLAKISTAIIKARIERGMTQKEFASLLGVSQSMVSKWESENYNFSIEALANICEKLDWDLTVDMRPRSSSNFSHLRQSAFKTWKTNTTIGNNAVRFGVAS